MNTRDLDAGNEPRSFLEIHDQENETVITLPALCTISRVERDTDMVRGNISPKGKLTVMAEAVTEMDTAYFQLLLCLEKTARDWNMDFHLLNATEPLIRLRVLYGFI